MADASRKTRRIDDAGEKIGGARKDWRQRMLGVDDLESMTNDEAVEHVRKDNIWPQPDWGKVIEEGMPVDIAAHAKFIRDRLAQMPAPRRSTDDPSVVRGNFIRMTGRVRDLVMAARTPDDIKTLEGRLLDAVGGRTAVRSDRAVGDEYFSVFKGRQSPFYITGTDARRIRDMLSAGFPEKVPAWRKGVKLYPASEGGVVAIKDGQQQGPTFPNQDTAWEWLKERAKATPKATKTGPVMPPDRPHLDCLVREGLADHRDGRDISPEDFLSTFGFRGVEFGNWLPSDERQQVLNLAYDALHDLAEVMDIPPQAISLDGTLAIAFGARGQGNAAATYESGRKVLNMTRINGAGNVAHEWGHAFDNWVGDVDHEGPSHGVRSGTGWREHTKSWARKDALRNLTEEQASAWVKVIDLTYAVPLSMEEAATLVGDHIKRLTANAERLVADRDKVLEQPERLRNKKFLKDVEEWLPQNARKIAALEDRLKQLANGAHISETRQSQYLGEARKLCGPTGEYWSRPNELFARAFESYVFDQLMTTGKRSDYLVHGVEEDRYSDPEFKGNPYPVGTERELFSQAIREISETMRPRVVLNVGGPTLSI